jgi:hypothetical protein
MFLLLQALTFDYFHDTTLLFILVNPILKRKKEKFKASDFGW